MVSKFKVLSLLIVLIMTCSCSTTPPIVVHDEYGEMLADNELFRKDASDCALQANKGVQGTTVTQNSQKNDAVFAGIQLVRFFSDNASCIKSKGWRIKE